MSQLKEVTAKEAAEILKNHPEYKLVDVREDFEREIATIVGSVQLTEELSEEIIQSWDKSTPIIFHCHHGGRSYAAGNYFREHGFTDISNMTGGIDAWSLEVDPAVARY